MRRSKNPEATPGLSPASPADAFSRPGESPDENGGNETGPEEAQHSHSPWTERTPISAMWTGAAGGSCRKRKRRSEGSGPAASTESGSTADLSRHSVGDATGTEVPLASSQPRIKVRGSQPASQTADGVVPAASPPRSNGDLGESSAPPSPSRRIGGISGNPGGSRSGSRWATIKGGTQGIGADSGEPGDGGDGGDGGAAEAGSWRASDRERVFDGTRAALGADVRDRGRAEVGAAGRRARILAEVDPRRTKTNRSGAAAPRPDRRSTGPPRRRTDGALRPQRPTIG